MTNILQGATKMKRKGADLLVMATVLAASISLPALAEGTKTPAEPATPTQEDMKKSTKRGIMIEPIRPKAPETKAAATTTKTKIDTKPSVKTTETAKVETKTTTKTAPVMKTAKSPVVKTETKTVTAITTGKHDATLKAVSTHATKSTSHQVATHTTKAAPAAEDGIVTAWLNKNGDKPHYTPGEKLQVHVSAQKDCNVLIFNYDGDMLTQLFPNDYQPNPMVKAGQTVEIGGEQSKFDFQASNDKAKISNEKIFVYAYPVESDSSPISVAMNPIPESPFRGVEFSLDQYRELVNSSKAFSGRSVKVMGKSKTQLVSFDEAQKTAAPPNKVELSLVIEGKKD